jgi:short subunit dehydrogenase-like uncharacterized protein
MFTRTSFLLSFVADPFMFCAMQALEQGTHYCDITGDCCDVMWRYMMQYD